MLFRSGDRAACVGCREASVTVRGLLRKNANEGEVGDYESRTASRAGGATLCARGWPLGKIHGVPKLRRDKFGWVIVDADDAAALRCKLGGRALETLVALATGSFPSSGARNWNRPILN